MLTIAEVYDRGLIDGIVTGNIQDHLVHPMYGKSQARRVIDQS